LWESDKLFEEIPVGVVMGLAYTSSGGSILYIEVKQSAFEEGKENCSLKITGNLKKVMEESV
jgi:Lon-like ATP-dependent protease